VAGAFHLVKGIVILLFPFLPKFASSVLAVMGIDGASWKELEKPDAGRRLTNERVLIERIDVEKIKK